MVRPQVDISRAEDGMLSDFAKVNGLSKAEAYAVGARLLIHLSDEVEFEPAEDDFVEKILSEINVSDDLNI